MLKALELVGFKSFADKTRFEFPAGITVIVGPNGSGKSNIVDAIRWVLGEQSAKSLRGRDMADVIFKGSGQGQRKVQNTAEATIVFDNAERRLPIEAPEVHITRRVYRSGEGEYLINRQACRLKDVRDLFRGTGVGTDAYSLIEQGKVDVLLQASPRDRRAMFEEAAGISRFKAKKVEAQRRLERVDQNLLRLADIVEEVGNRLRSVKAQAAKAQRYREYCDRLQQLRTHVALSEWRLLSQQLQEADRELSRLQDDLARAVTDVTAGEARLLEWETELISSGEALRELEHRSTRVREQILAREAQAERGRQQLEDLDAEAARSRGQLVLLAVRVEDVAHRVDQLRQQLADAEAEVGGLTRRLAQQDEDVTQCVTQLAARHADVERQRAEYLDGVRRASQWAQERALHDTQRQAAEALVAQGAERLAAVTRQLEESAPQLAAARDAETAAATQLAAVATRSDVAERTLEDSQRLLARRRDELAMQRGRLQGVGERADLLDELEQRQEGLTAGVQQVLAGARQDPGGPLQGVIGLVADVLEVPMQWAALVDAALGPVAQHVVLRDRGVLDAVEAGTLRLAGRVGFLALPDLAPEADPLETLAGCEGVLGRLDQLVHTAADLRPLATQLLGRVWAVELLSQARQLRAGGLTRVRLVTLAGEVVHPDGSVVAGPKDLGGLISRRTELRDLRREEAVLRRQVESGDAELDRLRDNVEQQQVALRQLADEHKRWTRGLADRQVVVRTLEQQAAQAREDAARLRLEHAAAQQQLTALCGQQVDTQQQQRALEGFLAELETTIVQAERRAGEGQRQLRRLQGRATATRVARAKCEQRLDSFRLQLRQLESDGRERARALADVRQRLASGVARRRDTLQSILDATSDTAGLYLVKDALAEEIAAREAQHRGLVAERAELAEQLKSKQRQLNQLREVCHQSELAAGQLRHARQTLRQRFQDDFAHDIEQWAERGADPLGMSGDAIDQEIATLKRKLSNIGAVNMEALDELQDLEYRYNSLHQQFQDLSEAKASLERIIQRINADSRRLFSETLEAIRVNFQQLYRKAFGGGKADLVLEEGADILEGGIDIVVTPPGKPSFSNTLLSGGEKALTAVALLLAIFQYRPSPFCVLDEVDAPFDEANITRFIDVLQGFLGWTKFVLVTHSKKTMTAAHTLYGVTMQESGVSKQVSVRFEDVSEDGQISPAAVRRGETTPPADDERAA